MQSELTDQHGNQSMGILNRANTEVIYMRKEWQSLFCSVSSQDTLSYVGSTRGDEWSDGTLRTCHGVIAAEVRNGIVDFIRSSAWREQSVRRLREEQWVRRGWEAGNRLSLVGNMNTLVDRLISAGPLRVEIAAGPEGGFIPAMLAVDPSASMLVSDVEHAVLDEWSSLLRQQAPDMNLSFACFDARNIPIKNGSVDCFSSINGLTSIPNHHLAIREIFRVLRPGGFLVVQEIQVAPNTMKELKTHLHDLWRVLPGVSNGWAKLLRSCGYAVCLDDIANRQILGPDAWSVAVHARSYGVEMNVETHNLVAMKPYCLGSD